MTQGKPIKASDMPETKKDIPTKETPTERSARLETEAAAGAYDPLAPETIPEQQDQKEKAEQENTDFTIIEALQNELDNTKDQMMRALAEAENTRRRAQKERENASRYAIANFAKELLSVSDNLRRALDSVPDDLIKIDVRIKNLLDGIEATERELLRSFKKNGIEKLESIDEIFNPNFHEVMFETTNSGKPAGTITQIIETGYMINGRLLRPARVGIAKDEGQGSGSNANESTPGDTLDTEA